MPRIPSAADVAPVGAAASRLPAVRADAADFGLAAAQGLAEFGEGLVAARPLAEEILRTEEKRKEAEQEAESKTHNAEMRETAFQAVDRWEDRKSNTSELQSLMRTQYAVFCMTTKT